MHTAHSIGHAVGSGACCHEEGISILPGYFTDKLYNADNLNFVPMVGEGEYEEIIAAWRRDSVNPILEQFLGSLRAACPLSEYN